MSNPPTPKIYRCLAIQLVRLKKLQELDVLEDLTDFDYLANLEQISSKVLSKLVSQRVVPDNFEEQFTLDLKRVCFIRDQFKNDSAKLGFLLEQANDFYGKFIDLAFEFGPNEIEEAKEALIELEGKFDQLFHEIERLHYAPDWNKEGKLDPILLEYHQLEKNYNYYDNVSPALISFGKSPSEFKDTIAKLIVNFKKILDQKNEDYRKAKLKETQIENLYREGKLEQLRASIEEIRFFKGIAENEKSKMTRYDSLIEEKKVLRHKVDQLVKQSDYVSAKELINDFEISANKLCGGLKKNLDTGSILNEYQLSLYGYNVTSYTEKTVYPQEGCAKFFYFALILVIVIVIFSA